MYPIVHERLAERTQLELNRLHQRSFGWCVTGHNEIGCPRGECPDVEEQSLIKRFGVK